MKITDALTLRLTEEPGTRSIYGPWARSLIRADSDHPTTFVFETADVCVMCFSVVDERTYQAVLDKVRSAACGASLTRRPQWIPAASLNPDLPIVLVGTHIDLRPDGKKKAKAAQAPAQQIPEELKKPSEHPKHCLAQMPSDVLQKIFSCAPSPHRADAFS